MFEDPSIIVAVRQPASLKLMAKLTKIVAKCHPHATAQTEGEVLIFKDRSISTKMHEGLTPREMRKQKQ